VDPKKSKTNKPCKPQPSHKWLNSPPCNFFVFVYSYKYKLFIFFVNMDERRICKICGNSFYVGIRARWVCSSCSQRSAIVVGKTRLKDLHYPNNLSKQNDVNSARELLNDLGYNVEGDVHQQFLERCRSRGIIF